MKNDYGPWAVVTGASAGIGKEFAIQLADAGLNVVLVARRRAKLVELATTLGQRNVQVEVLRADLTERKGLEQVIEATRSLDVGLLVNNAGTGVFGDFLRNSADAEASVVDLNVRAPIVLSHAFGNRMRARGKGGILILSSLVGLLGVRSFANYAATKAYDLALAEGLAAETSGIIDVHAVLPGFTESEYMDGMDITRIPLPLAKASHVVSGALHGLGRRRVLIVPGMINKMMAFVTTYSPRWLNTWAMGRLMGRMKPKSLPAGSGSSPVVADAAPSAEGRE
ncbi:MAG: SDR family NAD(P)-dependent oxidoreductase [Bacteroidota bacterium]